MSHLILGGTGNVGSGVVRGLLARGEKVRVLTRSAEKAKALPTGATAVIGDLQDPSTFESIFAGVDGVFLLNGLVPTELQEGLAAVNEARRAGVRRLVYLSVQDVEKGAHIPHFASKIAIERAIVGSGIPFTILRPNNFYQNDVLFQEAITRYGVYPQPIGDVGVSRVDVRDIAAAAVNALTQPGHEGKAYVIAGPEPLTGQQTAGIYSRVLGREILYAGNDLAAWSKQAMASLPAWLVYDLGLMYAMFQATGLKASDAQQKETGTVVGAPPRRFEDWVRETTASWK
jgi:uncharacterized protein YbjT (DUF2867 family)